MGFLFIIFGTLMWSLDTLIRYPLLASLKPETIVFTEHLVLSLIFLPSLILAKRKMRSYGLSALVSFLVIGVVGSAISTLAFTTAFSLINPSLVILLQKLQPIIVISLSAIVLQEQIKKQFYLFALLALVGGLLVSYPDFARLLESTQPEQGVMLGYFLTLLAVAGWAAATVFGKKLTLQGFTERQIMSGRFFFGFWSLLIYCSINSGLPTSSFGIDTSLKIAAMVLLSGMLGMFLYYKGLKLLSAHNASIAEMFFPVSAIAINWIFLGKELHAVQIAGAVILIGASLGINRNQAKL